MPPNSLPAALQAQYEAHLVRQAELIRDWPAGAQRDEQASIHVRLALWEQSMGKISEATKYRVYSILSFAMPDDAATVDEPTPEHVLAEQAEWELAYQEQLRRQTCVECGDGLCPVENDPRRQL